MTPEVAEELGNYYLKMTNKERNKDSGNNGEIKIILDNDLITPEYLEELSKKFFKLANVLKSEDNKDDSESSGNDSEGSGNNSESSENNSENNSGNNSGNNGGNNGGNNSGNNSGNNIYYDKKLVDESKDLLEKTKKYNKDKKYTSVDEVLKRLNARAENDRKTNEILEEAQRASKEVDKFNKMINDNLDMSSEKSEIINRLIELYSCINIPFE